jgi:LSD1 subclass zinc finger protein
LIVGLKLLLQVKPPMLLECLNAACRTPLVYLRGGRIVRAQYRSGAILKLEHFWLCEVCSRVYNFRIFSDRPAIAIYSGPHRQRYVTAEQADVMPRPTAGQGPLGSPRPRGPESSGYLSRPEVSSPLPRHLPSQQAASERFGTPSINRA